MPTSHTTHPQGLYLLFFVEMWERFSYYGMRSLLVLYLISDQGWADDRAFSLYGTYTSLVYVTPLIGGWLADRLLGTQRSLVIGGADHRAGALFAGLFWTGDGDVLSGASPHHYWDRVF